jgi:predicted XRE-type DNA-binding protein
VTKNNKTTNSSDLQDKIRDAQVKNILEKLKSGKTLTARESVIIGEYAAEKDNNGKKLTQRDIAKAWGMTQPNVHKMVKQGMPMDSMEAAAEWRKDFLEGRGRGSDAPASLNDARLRKTLLECERIELALAIDRGEYSKNTEVKESGIRIGSIFTAKLNALVNDASGSLAGLDEPSLKKKLHERVQAILAEIKTELEKV